MAYMSRNGKRRWLVTYVVCLLSVIFFGSFFVVKTQRRLARRGEFVRKMEREKQGEWSRTLLQDGVCFPVRGEDFSFEDGYGEGRSYGGNRSHEGIDIMSGDGVRGVQQVQSVSAGVVEQLGWLELGGYRVGIRSTSGIYFYYAHLDSYAPGLKQGDQVEPGTLLGYMGDTGYGEEGTKGKFPVHLHFGIYYNQNQKEKSLNPFPLLEYLKY